MNLKFYIFIISFFYYCNCKKNDQLNDLINSPYVDPDSLSLNNNETNDIIYAESLVLSNKKKQYTLIMSDEFNKENRNFKNGNDPIWTALDHPDITNHAIQYYSSDMISTNNGYLNITTIPEINKNIKINKNEYVDKYFKSGMLQSWDKFCFSGGIIEIKAKLPGRSNVAGLWPAMWLMGNLARATYVDSTSFLWPWSLEGCDPSYQYSEAISGCDGSGHYNLNPYQSRGSPEIDILEVMAGSNSIDGVLKTPYISTSLQIAPGAKTRPNQGELPMEWEWYQNLEIPQNGIQSELNKYYYGMFVTPDPIPSASKGYQMDAVSLNTNLNETYFNEDHIYKLEWEPKGYIRWYLNDELIFGIKQKSLTDLTGSSVPFEPSYLIFNTAVSPTWGWPFCECSEDICSDCYDCNDPICRSCVLPDGFCEMLPSSFLIDYVRIYQDLNNTNHLYGCDTAEYPSEKWIQAYAYKYKDVDDKVPLDEIKMGGASCKEDNDCGGLYNTGRCGKKTSKCKCFEGWTGPTCLSPYIKSIESISSIGNIFEQISPFQFPNTFVFLFTVITVFLSSSIIIRVFEIKKKEENLEKEKSTKSHPSNLSYY